MDAILLYAIGLFPLLLLLWVVFQELRKHFRSEQDKIYIEIGRGIAKAQGWISFSDAVELLENGGTSIQEVFMQQAGLAIFPRPSFRRAPFRF